MNRKRPQSDKYSVHISLFLGIKMKDKFPSSSPKFSQQRNIIVFLNFLILIFFFFIFNYLIFLNLFQCPNLVIIHRYYSFDTRYHHHHQMHERNCRKKLPKEKVRLFIVLFISLFYACSSSQHTHHPCLKSIPFLYFSPDHLRSTLGII